MIEVLRPNRIGVYSLQMRVIGVIGKRIHLRVAIGIRIGQLLDGGVLRRWRLLLDIGAHDIDSVITPFYFTLTILSFGEGYTAAEEVFIIPL